MSFNNKGIQSHLILVLIISLIMTILIVSVLSPVFKVDHRNCLDYEFEIQKSCIDGNNVKFKIANKVEKAMFFNVSGTQVIELKPKEIKDFTYTASKGNVQIVPFFYGSIDRNVYECSSLRKTINTMRILKC